MSVVVAVACWCGPLSERLARVHQFAACDAVEYDHRISIVGGSSIEDQVFEELDKLSGLLGRPALALISVLGTIVSRGAGELAALAARPDVGCVAWTLESRAEAESARDLLAAAESARDLLAESAGAPAAGRVEVSFLPDAEGGAP